MFSPHPMDQQVNSCCHNFLTVTHSDNSKNTPIGKFHAVKIAKSVLLYVFTMAFLRSSFQISTCRLDFYESHTIFLFILLGELWLQGEAALQTQSFRDAEPQLVIPPKTKDNHGMPPVQLRPGRNICMTTTDPCPPIIAWK